MDYNKPPPYNPGEYQQNQPQGPPQAYPQPQPQYYPQSQPINVTLQQQPAPTTTVIVTPGANIVTGNCPACRRGVLGYSFTCCGVCCAIIFFPVGIICCFLFAKKRCSHCRAYF